MREDISETCIRLAHRDDEDQVLALFPRLHAFQVHDNRNPEDLWRHDATQAKKHFAGKAPQCFIYVADAGSATSGVHIVGMAMVTMQKEFMGHEPGAHLEALAIADGYEGQGLGRRLIDTAEMEAGRRGAKSITLHVFTSNERAAALYRRLGYEFEIQRCIKWL